MGTISQHPPFYKIKIIQFTSLTAFERYRGSCKILQSKFTVNNDRVWSMNNMHGTKILHPNVRSVDVTSLISVNIVTKYSECGTVR